MQRILAHRFISFILNWPRSILAVYLLLLAFAGLQARDIELRTSNLDLISADLPEVKRFVAFANDFGNPNVLVLVLSGADVTEAAAVIPELAQNLQQLSDVRRVVFSNPAITTHTHGAQEPTIKITQELLSNRQHDTFYIFIQPQDTRSDVIAFERLVKSVRSVTSSFELKNNVSIGFTGIPQYALDDRDIIQKDITTYSGISLLLVVIIFVVGFHSFARPALAAVSLAAAVVLTLGIVHVYPGHLTLLSSSFIAMIFGLGIDYGIHIVHRVEELLAQATVENFQAKKAAVEKALLDLFPSLTTAALTTAGAFFVLLVSDFKGFEELGFIAGVGIIVSFLVNYSFLPALLLIISERSSRKKTELPDMQLSRLSRLLLAMQSPIVAGTLFVATGLLIFIPPPAFNSNYLSLQPSNSQAVALEQEMVDNSSYSPYFAAFSTSSLAEAEKVAAKARSSQTVGEVRTLSDFTKKEIPEPLRAELLAVGEPYFKSTSGKYAVYSYPKESIWIPASEKAFLSEMKAIDENVTGMPFIGNVMIERSKSALHVTTDLAAIVLVVLVGLQFRRITPTIIALAAPAGTILWMLASMRFLEMDFNPLNVMAFPIILGIAIDDGVHIIHRFLEEDGNMEKTIAATGRSVLLTTLTTLAAFACLTATTHLGFRSLCLLLSIGVTAAFILSVVVLPQLLRIFQKQLLRH